MQARIGPTAGRWTKHCLLEMVPCLPGRVPSCPSIDARSSAPAANIEASCLHTPQSDSRPDCFPRTDRAPLAPFPEAMRYKRRTVFLVEIAKAFGLEPIGEDTKQQAPRQMIQGSRPETLRS